MATLDEEIARHLHEALESGELRQATGFGKPLPDTPGWDETPEALRMPFKILKDSGFAPPEIVLFHQRAELRILLEACTDELEKERLRRALGELEQKISLRLESLKGNARI